MRTHCINSKCGDDLFAWKNANYKPERRTGRFLCPACWYFGKRVFGVAVALTGTVCGIAWWIVNHL